MKFKVKKIKGRMQKILLADKINIIIAILTAISTLFALLTVIQMKKDRDAAYKPTILINPTEYEFSWDKNGNEEWITSMSNKSSNEYIHNEDGIITGTISIPMLVVTEDGLEKLSAVNAGVGNARDVVFEWDKNNINRLNDYLIECDATKKEFMLLDKSVVFSINDGLVMTNIPEKFGLMYMLSEASETYSIPIPVAYSMLLHEIIKTQKYDNSIPYLVLYARYFDIQGNKIEDAFLIQVKQTFIEEDETGTGRARIQLIPAFLA